MQPVRIGFIGAGWVAQNRHLPGLRGIEGVAVRRVWSRDPAKAAKVAALCGAKTAGTWEEVAEAPDLDAVVIASPPGLHAAATILALAAGKHVLCQARMARNVSEARGMIEAAGRSDRVTSLYPPKPGLKGDRFLRRLLGEGRIGRIREVRLTALALNPPDPGYRWTNDPDVVGVNAMVVGMWAEVLNRWVGPAAKLGAIARCHLPERLTSDGGKAPAVVPDSLAIAAELRCGATASYHFSACAAGGPGHTIEIFGSEGALGYRLFQDEAQAAFGGTEWKPLSIPPEEERTQSTDREFIEAIRGGPSVRPDFAEGLAYMEFCEAAAWSAHSGAAVALPLASPLMESWGRPLD